MDVEIDAMQVNRLLFSTWLAGGLAFAREMGEKGTERSKDALIRYWIEWMNLECKDAGFDDMEADVLGHVEMDADSTNWAARVTRCLRE